MLDKFSYFNSSVDKFKYFSFTFFQVHLPYAELSNIVLNGINIIKLCFKFKANYYVTTINKKNHLCERDRIAGCIDINRTAQVYAVSQEILA